MQGSVYVGIGVQAAALRPHAREALRRRAGEHKGLQPVDRPYLGQAALVGAPRMMSARSAGYHRLPPTGCRYPVGVELRAMVDQPDAGCMGGADPFDDGGGEGLRPT